MSGKVPINISIIFANSSTPKVINKIGRIASGGMIEITVMNIALTDSNVADSPMLTPMISPSSAAAKIPIKMRCKLDIVSFNMRYLSVFTSFVKAMRCTASSICIGVGKIL